MKQNRIGTRSGAAILGVLCCATITFAAAIGQTLSNVQVTNAFKKQVEIPNLGSKVVAVFYNDYEGADMNDPCADVLKAAKIPEASFYSCGIANLKDNPKWLADWVVRLVVKGKVEKYKTDIFLDYKHVVKNAWDLGDCNDGSVLVIIGKDRKIKYLKKVKTKEESGAIAPAVLAIINAEIKK